MEIEVISHFAGLVKAIMKMNNNFFFKLIKMKSTYIGQEKMGFFFQFLNFH